MLQPLSSGCHGKILRDFFYLLARVRFGEAVRFLKRGREYNRNICIIRHVIRSFTQRIAILDILGKLAF